MRRRTGSALVKVRAFCLFGAKQLAEQLLTYCQLDHLATNLNKFNRYTIFFIHENAFESMVCEMAAVLASGRLVKIMVIPLSIHFGDEDHAINTEFAFKNGNFIMRLFRKDQRVTVSWRTCWTLTSYYGRTLLTI